MLRIRSGENGKGDIILIHISVRRYHRRYHRRCRHRFPFSRENISDMKIQKRWEFHAVARWDVEADDVAVAAADVGGCAPATAVHDPHASHARPGITWEICACGAEPERTHRFRETHTSCSVMMIIVSGSGDGGRHARVSARI